MLADTLKLLVDETDVEIGQSLFETTVQKLTELLNIDIAFIGEISTDCESVKTLAVAENGHIIENFTYYLNDTPCRDVLDRTYCHYDSGIYNAYPKDQLLIDMQIEAYAGYPLVSSKGKPLGILVCLNRSKINDMDDIFDLIRITARRVEAELERVMLERALRESEHNRIAAETVRSAVLQNVSHELRTPLNAIMGYCELLKFERSESMSPKMLEESLSIIQKSGSELLSSISTMLEVAQLQSDSYQLCLRDSSLKAMCSEAIAEVRQNYPNNRYDILFPMDDAVIHVDAYLFKRCLFQLINNAAQHSLPGTEIHLTIAILEKETRITIQDNGPGITASKISQISEAFQLGENFDTKTSGGLGLGLALVREALLAMQCKFSIQNRTSHGVRVQIIIPN